MAVGSDDGSGTDDGLGVDVAVEAVPGAVSLGAGLPGAAAAVRTGLRDAGPLAAAGFLANGANVVVTVILARVLSTRGYGALAQLTSLFLIVSLPGTALTVGVVRRVAAWHGVGVGSAVWRWARRVHLRVTAVAAGFAVVILGVRGPLAGALSIPTPLGVFAVLAAAATWVVLSLDRGLLQSHRDYRALSVNLLVEGGCRTVAVLGLGAAAGVAGCAWGMLVAELVTAAHARLVADGRWAAEAARAHGAVEEAPAPERRMLVADLAAALVAMGLLAWLQNIDVIVLGRDAPHRSGAYAAVSVASKAIVFGALVLAGYLLPESAHRWRHGGHALHQLGVTLLVLAVPVVALLVAAVGFPHLLLSVVFSGRYLGAEQALAVLVLAMACLGTTVVLTMYLLGAGQRFVVGLLGAGAVAATVAVLSAHGDPRRTASADLAVQGVLLAATVGCFAVVHRRHLRRP